MRTPAPAAVVENPTLTPPAPDTDICVSVSTVLEVAAVVLPRTNSESAVPDAPPAAAEITKVDPLQPALTFPVALTAKAVRTRVVELVPAVVFPAADIDCAEGRVAPEKTKLPPENPALIPPVTEIVWSVSDTVEVELTAVVLPTTCPATGMPLLKLT